MEEADLTEVEATSVVAATSDFVDLDTHFFHAHSTCIPPSFSDSKCKT